MKRLVGNVLQLTAATVYCLLYNWDFLCEKPNTTTEKAQGRIQLWHNLIDLELAFHGQKFLLINKEIYFRSSELQNIQVQFN
jgi:hypothetical protein